MPQLLAILARDPTREYTTHELVELWAPDVIDPLQHTIFDLCALERRGCATMRYKGPDTLWKFRRRMR